MSKYDVILLVIILLVTGCFGDKAQAAEQSTISLDPNVLPIKSEFKIEGTFGDLVRNPYKLTISQTGTNVQFTSNMSMPWKGEIDFKAFQDLWKASCEGNITSLNTSYGKWSSTASFQGKFTCKIYLKDQVISKEAFLTYGIIKDKRFEKIFDKIMEAVPPDAHLPFTLYSIKTLNYNELPISATLRLVGNRHEPLYLHEIYLTLEKDKINISEVIVNQNDSSSRDKQISKDEFTKFWKKSASIDLVSLNDAHRKRQISNELDWYVWVELETTRGWFTVYRTFSNQEVSDEKLSNFLNMIIDLADSNLTIPVKVE